MEEGKFYVLPELLYAYNDLMPQTSKEQTKLHHCARIDVFICTEYRIKIGGC